MTHIHPKWKQHHAIHVKYIVIEESESESMSVCIQKHDVIFYELCICGMIWLQMLCWGFTYGDYNEDDVDKDVDNAETKFVVISYRGTMRWS